MTISLSGGEPELRILDREAESAPDSWLPDRGVLLHIGPRKTATTLLQSALATARTELRKKGILYPGGAFNHTTECKELTGGNNCTRWGELASSVQCHVGRSVVSSELLEHASSEQAKRAVVELGGGDTRVLVTLRPLDKMLPSLWQHAVRWGSTTPYDQWLSLFLSDGDWPWHKGRYDRLVRRWADAAGAQNTMVLVADSNHPRFVLDSAEHLLRLPSHFLSARRTNRSLTVEEAEVLQLRNKSMRNRGLDSKVPYWNPQMNRIIDNRTVGANEHRLSFPIDRIEELRRLQQEVLTGIQDCGVSVIGDLGRLDVDPKAGDQPSTPAPVDLREGRETAPQVAADLVAALQVANHEANRKLRHLRQSERRTTQDRAEKRSPTSLLGELSNRAIRLTRKYS